MEANPESRSDFQFAGTYLTGASLCDADNLEIQNSDSLSLLKKLALGCTLLQRADFINMINCNIHIRMLLSFIALLAFLYLSQSEIQ